MMLDPWDELLIEAAMGVSVLCICLATVLAAPF